MMPCGMLASSASARLCSVVKLVLVEAPPCVRRYLSRLAAMVA
jgi:hypothetical protein